MPVAFQCFEKTTKPHRSWADRFWADRAEQETYELDLALLIFFQIS